MLKWQYEVAMNDQEMCVDGQELRFSECIVEIFYHDHIVICLEDDETMCLDDCLQECGYNYDNEVVTVEHYKNGIKEVFDYTGKCVHYWIQTIREEL